MSQKINCCIIGDLEVGKTCIVESYTLGSYPRKYKNTILDVYSALVNVGNDSITLRLFDLSGSHDTLQYRKEIIKNCDVAIICYSLMDRKTLKSVKKFWIHEIRSSAPNIPLVLAGTKLDIYSTTAEDHKPIDYEAKIVAKKLGFEDSLECSALTQENLKAIFDCAILSCVRLDEEVDNVKKNKCVIF